MMKKFRGESFCKCADFRLKNSRKSECYDILLDACFEYRQKCALTSLCFVLSKYTKLHEQEILPIPRTVIGYFVCLCMHITLFIFIKYYC